MKAVYVPVYSYFMAWGKIASETIWICMANVGIREQIPFLAMSSTLHVPIIISTYKNRSIERHN